MESFMMKAIQLIVALLLLVTVHEFGHYIFSRMFGIKVNRFYLFFNPWFSLLKYFPDKGKLQLIAWTRKVRKDSAAGGTAEGDDTMKAADEGGAEEEKRGGWLSRLFGGKDSKGAKEKKPVEEYEEEPRALLTINLKKKYKDTNKKGRPSWAATMYGIGWLPLGGYCDIAGMVDETKGVDDLASEPQPWEFRTKAAWKRFLVMVAGVLMNFVLAIVIYAGIAYHWGDKVVPFQSAAEGMEYAQPMKDTGLRDGDILLAVNGQKADAKDWSATTWQMMQPGAEVTVLRDGSDTVKVTVSDTTLDAMVKLNQPPITDYRVPVYADKVQGGMAAAKAGMVEGDHIVEVAGVATPSMREFYDQLEKNKGKKVAVTVERGDSTVRLEAQLSDEGKLGIMLRPIDKIYDVETKEYTLLQSIPRGWEIGTTTLGNYVSSLKLLFTKEGVQQVGGFGAIGSMFPDSWDWYSFWQITAFLSVILAFMNIIPIPGLDGGHVLFLLWEIITGKKPSDSFLEKVNTAGFFFLLLLLLLANGNDLLRLFQ